ncbi:regulator of G-protein signaling 11 [Platysternon megacephalum]|uniref:Ribonuclease n=1 Tax=Platysternon megacephalum TaxID=55544 RepID=A0A4D9DXG6_9SAUR|nr:regulator of G-protein signaling 11 [Platysternon megacephalum]
MAPKGPHPMLLLALVLLAGWLAQLGQGASYPQFLRQHVDNPKTRARDDRTYCNMMMQRRGMASPCKHTNTFVHAPARQLQDVCGPAGRRVSRNLYDSNNRYRITTCRLAGGSTRPPCNYRGHSSTRRIRVACVGGLPVHYDRTL